jgi:predicted transcriptional regulator
MGEERKKINVILDVINTNTNEQMGPTIGTTLIMP